MKRRDFLKIGGGLFLVQTIQGRHGRYKKMVMGGGPIPGGTLNPRTVAKFQSSLQIPGVMLAFGEIDLGDGKKADYYEISVRQFNQQVLPSPLPSTIVWGYGATGQPATFSYPALTIEATQNKPVRVKWINGLVDSQGNYLPHLLAVDQTLHWANPPGPSDSHSMNPSRYTGPVPIVSHLHGAHSGEESDGYPEAWYLPKAANIPAGYSKSGHFYPTFKAKAEALYGQIWDEGSAVFQYPNDQRATSLWYHDHSLGMTRANVYAGPVGFYLIRGGPDEFRGTLPGPAPKAGDPAGQTYLEIPIVI